MANKFFYNILRLIVLIPSLFLAFLSILVVLRGETSFEELWAPAFLMHTAIGGLYLSYIFLYVTIKGERILIKFFVDIIKMEVLPYKIKEYNHLEHDKVKSIIFKMDGGSVYIVSDRVTSNYPKLVELVEKNATLNKQLLPGSWNTFNVSYYVCLGILIFWVICVKVIQN